MNQFLNKDVVKEEDAKTVELVSALSLENVDQVIEQKEEAGWGFGTFSSMSVDTGGPSTWL